MRKIAAACLGAVAPAALVQATCVTLLSSIVTIFGLWLAFGRVCR